jgi:NADH-quinone oxidoreductase subunit M
MMLAALIGIPFVGGAVAWLGERLGPRWPRWIALAALFADALLTVSLWLGASGAVGLGTPDAWFVDLDRPWIPHFGIRFHLAMDGISLLLVALTTVLGIVAVIGAWTEIDERSGFFHFNLLWVLSGVLGVFLAVDLFLFYFFWELMLVPMYFLIAIWGHENRTYAAVKFFLFTQASGLLMLLSILGLYFIHARQTGVATFDYQLLLDTPISGPPAVLLMLGFFAAFAVKLPVVPLHTWLPDAHTQAPTAGSIVLAGLLLKTGGYGFLRFAIPLFPAAARELAPYAMGLGVLGILYGALLAFAQTDLKRLVAYSSISHLGFVLLGIFAWNDLALQGAVMQMICHGLSAGALFFVAGAVQERLHTRAFDRMGGFWTTAPRMGAVSLFFVMASLGLPGLGNFVGEFLVLVGTYQRSPAMAAAAAAGLVLATAYSLAIMQRVFHGHRPEGVELPDFGALQTTSLAVLVAGLIWLGVYPKATLRAAAPALQATRAEASQTEEPGAAPLASGAVEPSPASPSGVSPREAS